MRELGIEGWSPAALTPTILGALGETSRIDTYRTIASGANDAVWEFADVATVAPVSVAVVTLLLTALLFRRRYVP